MHSIDSPPRAAAVLAQLPGIAWTTDRQLRITSLSGAGADGAGANESPVGRAIAEVFLPVDGAGLPESIHCRAMGREASPVAFFWGRRAYQGSVGPLRSDAGKVVGCVGAALECPSGTLIDASTPAREPSYREIIEGHSDLIARFTPDTVLTYVNDAYCRYFNRSRQQLLGASFLDLIDEGDRPATRAALARLSPQQPTVRNEERTVLATGEVRWQQWINRAIFNDHGATISIQSAGRDITDRKRLEEALRESEDRYRVLVEASPDGMVIVDAATGQRVGANQQLCEMLGYREEELPVRAEEVTPAESLGRVRELFAAQAAGDLPVAEKVPFMKKDGQIFYAEVRGRRIRYGGRDCLVSFVRDTTDRARAEEALRASEERFRVAFDEAPVGMVIGVGSGIISRVNRALCRMSGYSPQELIGRHVGEFMHPDDRELSAEQVQKLLAGELSSFSVERRYIAKGGRVFWAQATTAAALRPDGRIAFALGVIEDIDQRKKARESLLRQRQTLRRLLQSSDHERRLIAYEIHDGLAQQLAAAIMQLQAYEQFQDDSAEHCREALRAGVRMLQQAHAETRRLISGVRPPILDESGIAAALAHLAHDHESASGPEIEYHCRVEFDRLAAVVENAAYRIAQEALVNACRHSRSGRVRLALEQLGDRMRLEVRDWGVGFDPAAIGEGCFGLEGMRERARLLGGEFHIDSGAGRGTTVCATLPIVAPEPLAEPAGE